MTHMNKDHPLFREVLGLGNRIVIPNLCMDGAYGMSVFEKAGFCSLVAVPITTYKVLGILGAADGKKRRFSNDIAQLLSVIASLIGVSLTKTNIMQKVLPERIELPGEPEPDIAINIKPDIADDTITEREISHPVISETIANRETITPIDNNTATSREPGYRIGNDMITNRQAGRRNVRATDEKTDAFSRHARKMTRFRELHK